MKLAALTIALLLPALLVPSSVGADEVQDSVTKLLAGRTDSLVIVEFDLKKADGTGGQEVKLQGTIVGKEGLVLVSGAKQVDPPVGSTNARPEKFKVRFQGDVKRDATFVGKDEELNLALLRVTPAEGEKDGFAVAGFDPTAALSPGEPLLALKRLGQADDDLVTFRILRVATIIPRPGLPTEYQLIGGMSGFEGCPVYALDTRLVGFVAAATRARNRGRGFRFVGGRLERTAPGGGGDAKGHPIRLLHSREIREFLSDPTTFARRDCWLGVKGLQALTKPLAEAYGIEKPGGLVIGDVSEKSPAERAGLRAGDVIVAFDGTPVETTKDRDIASFTRKIRRGKAGAEHEFVVLRAAEVGFTKLSVGVVLDEAPLSENEVPDYHDKTFGLKLKPLTRDFLDKSRLPHDSNGLRVTSVEPASWAYIAGIRSGDVIQKMVLKPCQNLEQYKKIMGELMKTRDAEVCYNVTRARKSLFLCVRPDWETVEKPEK